MRGRGEIEEDKENDVRKKKEEQRNEKSVGWVSQ